MAMNQTSASPKTEKGNPTLKKLAIIFAIVCGLTLFLPVKYLTFVPQYSIHTLNSHIYVTTLFKVLNGPVKFLGFIPVIGPGSLNLGFSIGVYASVITLIVSLVLAIVAIFRNKGAACLLKTSLFLFTWSFAIYSISLTVVSSYMWKIRTVVDPFTCLLAIAGALCYLKLSLNENKRSAWLIAGQFLLSLITSALLFLALTLDGHLVSEMTKSPRAKFVVTLASVAIFASLFLTTLLSLKHNKWTALVQLINMVALLALSLCLTLVSHLTNVYIESYLIYTLLAAVTAFLAILLCIFSFFVLEKKAEAAAEDTYLNNYELEEYVEVIAYDPAKAQYAEKVNNKSAATETPISEETEEIPDDPEKEALFEGKEDAFIATLTKAEKYEFADLYILKTKGSMGGIPTYEVGADNKAFFKKIFIYLSQFREKISSELLAKIYDYSEQA
ncbi:MAG: hypothetical protein IJX30_04790 [Clostridia bacterium]|nr:hypothetical protein [Clostridia bacterium]